jgi:lipoate-protein ligase A
MEQYLRIDIDKMFSVLRVPAEKIKDKAIHDVKERVMGLQVSFNVIATQLRQSFGQSFQAEVFKDSLKTGEIIEAKIMQKYKYGSHDWNYRR